MVSMEELLDFCVNFGSGGARNCPAQAHGYVIPSRAALRCSTRERFPRVRSRRHAALCGHVEIFASHTPQVDPSSKPVQAHYASTE